MKSTVFIPNSTIYEYDQSVELPDHVWTGKFNYDKLKLNPPTKVSSVIEIFEETNKSAISFQGNFIVISNVLKTPKCAESIHLLNLRNKRVYFLRKFDCQCTHLAFLSKHENLLIVGLENGSLYQCNVDSNIWTEIHKHLSSVLGSELFNQSTEGHFLSWTASEALIWLWPSYNSIKRLRVDSTSTIVTSGFLQGKNQIFAAFEVGTLILWDLDQPNKNESTIVIPDGIDMKFTSFSLSKDGCWLVGGGCEPIYVTYSLVSQRVSQIVSVSHHDCLPRINQIQFLTSIHPKYSKCLLLSSSNAIIVSDFENSNSVKVLRSQHHPIVHVSLSGNGFLLCVTYGHGCTKVYSLASFFPPLSNEEILLTKNHNLEVELRVMEEEPFFKTKTETKKKSHVERLLDPKKWLKILDEFGSYPQKYRKHIWTSLLDLPRNFSVFSNLLSKQSHRWTPPLDILFPDTPSSLIHSLESTLSSLCCWCPFLSCVNILPSLIYPFVELFQENLLLCFEISVILILNWFRPWLEAFPSCPTQVTNFVDEFLCEVDPPLWLHLKNLSLTTDFVVLTLFSTSLAKVLSDKDWYVAWDQILSERSSFYLVILTSFILVKKQTLLQCKTFDEAKEVFLQESFIPAKVLIKKSKFLYPKLNEDFKSRFDSMTYIPKGDLAPLPIHLKKKVTSFDLKKYSYMDSFLHSRTSCDNRELQIKPRSVLLNPERISLSDLVTKGNECIKRINQVRKKQTVRFDV